MEMDATLNASLKKDGLALVVLGLCQILAKI